MKKIVVSLVLAISLSGVILVGQPIDSNIVKPLTHGAGS